MKKRLASLALVFLMLAQICACGETKDPSDTSDNTESTPAETVQEAYVYPELDCGGEDFVILNGSNTWGFYSFIDFESLTGETLDDAIFNRNRNLESKYEFYLKVVEYEQNSQLVPHLRSVIMSQEDIYDVVYCGANLIGPLISENYFYDLFEIPELQLDKPWWEQTVVKEGTIGKNGELYFAASDLQLFGLEGAWCMFFNETMLGNLALETPYDLVREGKWTFDELHKYMKAGANLNGAENFTFVAGGDAIYGLTSSYAYPTACIVAAGEHFIEKDKEGNPFFALETDRFFTLTDKIASMFGVEGEYCSKNNSGGQDHYEEIFRAGRALFLGAELKAAGKLRDFEDSFGIVPNPKLDENQAEYHSMISKAMLLTAIPVTNADTARAGIIMDALSYLSYLDTLPKYYDIRISQKSLRNDESIEMLKIIRDSRYFDIGDAYGWTTTLQDKIRRTLDVGNSEIASIIASEKSNVNTNIQATMDKMK